MYQSSQSVTGQPVPRAPPVQTTKYKKRFPFLLEADVCMAKHVGSGGDESYFEPKQVHDNLDGGHHVKFI